MTGFRDRLLVSDPALERLRFATRSMISLVLCGSSLLLLAHFHRVDGTTAVLGALIAVFATFQANDVVPRARKVTAALLVLPAGFAVSVVSLLSALHPVAGAVSFLAIAFPSIWSRRYGPRGFGLGMMAIVTAFYALFLQVHPAQLPAAFAAIALGTLTAWIAHFLILPDSPHLALASARAAFEARLRLVADAIKAVRDDPTSQTALRPQLIGLNAAAVTIDRLVAGGAFVLDAPKRLAVRIALLETELAADAAVDITAGGIPATTHARLHASLQTVLDARSDGTADAPISPGPQPPDIGGMKPATRQAWQMTTASAFAMAIGAAIPPHQYPWALLTAFIVYAGAASAAEARRRALSRAVGTAAGIVVGLVVVEIVKHHQPLEVALALIGLFCAMYLFRASYVAFTMFVTIAIAIIYDLVGRPTDQLLAARLIETIVGTVCGALAATVIVPLKTSAVVGTLGVAVAKALGRDDTSRSKRQMLDDVRDIDARLQEFLARARPLLEPAGGVTPGAQEAVDALVDCARRARAFILYRITSDGEQPAPADRVLRSARRLESAFSSADDSGLNWHAVAQILNDIATDYLAALPAVPRHGWPMPPPAP